MQLPQQLERGRVAALARLVVDLGRHGAALQHVHDEAEAARRQEVLTEGPGARQRPRVPDTRHQLAAEHLRSARHLVWRKISLITMKAFQLLIN